MKVQAQTQTELTEKLLQSSNPTAGMERLAMIVTDIAHPFSHVARITGKINPKQPQLWALPNVALRLEVGGEEEVINRPLTRVYTIRDFDLSTNQMEIDFIIHEGDAPAMHWLEGVEVGTSVFLIGPRQHFVPDYALDKKIAFFADDTAIPALYAILSQWPSQMRAPSVALYIDCADSAYADELPSIAGVSYHIHQREVGQHAGKNGYLLGASKAIEDIHNWQIWVACEREEARTIRQHFMAGEQSDKQNIKAVGYWKIGLSASQLDGARLAYYAKLHAAGKEMEQIEELDMPI